ncbi:MAG: IS200/IS605 family transposase [Pseudohongiellaceae bacterium]
MSKSTLKQQFHCVYKTQYHLVLVTKYRKRLLTQAALERFESLARSRAEAWEGEVLEVSGEADHVHLLIDLPPKVAVAEFVNALKTGTSRRLRNEFSDIKKAGPLWSRSYCVLTCGGAPLEIIKEYIQSQDRPDA